MSIKPIKVLVVDDSIFMQKMISDILNNHQGIQVIDKAANGKQALRSIEKSLPDVITLDVEMPVMNGIETLKEIQKKYQIPVVMVSSVTTSGAKITIQALELGAVDFITKPSGSISMDINKKAEEIIEKVLLAARTKIVKRVVKKVEFKPNRVVKSKKIVVIGISTGGPKALKDVIPLLPKDLPAPVLLVQHMPALFTASLAKRLDSMSLIEVKEAEENDSVTPGRVLLAPGDYHMELDAEGKVIKLNQQPSVWGVRPAVDITLGSAVKAYGRNVISVIMTGMGHDGSNAVKALKRFGGMCIAQDEETSTIYGMPKTVVDAGYADKIVSLYDIANAITEAVYS